MMQIGTARTIRAIAIHAASEQEKNEESMIGIQQTSQYTGLVQLQRTLAPSVHASVLVVATVSNPHHSYTLWSSSATFCWISST